MERIGFQSGIKAAMARLRKLDPGGTNASGTGAWDKLERTLSILANDHDAAITDPEPPPPPPPPPPPETDYAPRTYNIGSRNQDPRFCVTGLTRRADGLLVDGEGVLYDDSGLNVDGRRDRTKIVAGLKPADEMDGREPCDPYNGMPPWPAASYER